MGYAENERLKSSAWDRLRNHDLGLPQKVAAANDLLLAWYERSCIGVKRHPSFEVYRQCILSHESIISWGGPELAEFMRTMYGTRPGEIAEGYSCWYPPRSKMRADQFRVAESTRRRGA